MDHSYSLPVVDERRSQYHPNVDKVTEYSFLVRVQPTSKPDLSFEHTKYRWIKYEEAQNFLKWPKNKEALEYYENWLAEETWLLIVLCGAWARIIMSGGSIVDCHIIIEHSTLTTSLA